MDWAVIVACADGAQSADNQSGVSPAGSAGALSRSPKSKSSSDAAGVVACSDGAPIADNQSGVSPAGSAGGDSVSNSIPIAESQSGVPSAGSAPSRLFPGSLKSTLSSIPTVEVSGSGSA